MSIDPFVRLVKLAARAFYDDIPTKADNQPKMGRSDNRGLAVVVLDALTRKQWVREEDLAKELKLHSKQLRRTLRFFEEEKLITRDHRKETAKGAKIYSAAVAATVNSFQNGREGDEKVKLHTHSYCCLDYAQIYDVVRYRLYRMRKKLKDELDNKNIVVDYICPKCGRRYNALDALRLVDMNDDNFHCEVCNGIVEVDTGKLASQESGDGDDNARRRRRDKLEDMLKKMEVQLKPLTEQLNRVKDLRVPEFGSLQSWEARYGAAARALNGDLNGNDPSASGLGLGYGGTPMPYVGETKVEVAFSDIEAKGENIKSENGTAPMKILPPWMIKQGMNLTKEQRGEVKEEVKMDGSKAPAAAVDDKKFADEKDDDEKKRKEEFLKAYYAAIRQRQLEQEEATKREQELVNSNTANGDFDLSSGRQLGMKSKREDDEEEDDVEWEEAPAGNISKPFKVHDLNIQADDAAGDDDEDDGIDWEEG